MTKEDGTRNLDVCPGKNPGCCATLRLNYTIRDEKSGGIAAALISDDEPQVLVCTGDK